MNVNNVSKFKVKKSKPNQFSLFFCGALLDGEMQVDSVSGSSEISLWDEISPIAGFGDNST